MINCLLHYFIMSKLFFFELTGKFRVGHFYGAKHTRTYVGNIYCLFIIGFVCSIISDFGNPDISWYTITSTYYTILKICGRKSN